MEVAPLVGAWIEIGFVLQELKILVSVAPLVGAWIEINNGSTGAASDFGRSPRGSVD